MPSSEAEQQTDHGGVRNCRSLRPPISSAWLLAAKSEADRHPGADTQARHGPAELHSVAEGALGARIEEHAAKVRRIELRSLLVGGVKHSSDCQAQVVEALASLFLVFSELLSVIIQRPGPRLS